MTATRIAAGAIVMAAAATLYAQNAAVTITVDAAANRRAINPAVYAKVWEGFLKHMEKVTGKRVQFFPVQNNAAQIEAMRAGRLHVAGFNTGSNPIAVACAGFVPFAASFALLTWIWYEHNIYIYGVTSGRRRKALETRLEGSHQPA